MANIFSLWNRYFSWNGSQLNVKQGDFAIGGVPVYGGTGIGKVYFVDPINGSDSYDGRKPSRAFLSLEAAEDACTADQNDTVVMIGGATATSPAASITWDKSYTHLVGLCNTLGGCGQRCRVTGTADLDLSPVITVSANGCYFKNIQFYNGKDANTDSGCVLVSGQRNHFDSCMIAGMAHATPAARAGSYSLKVSGSENLFSDCYIGLDTIVRGAGAPADLYIDAGATRNTFKHCHVRYYSETAAATPIIIASGTDRFTMFEDCLVSNFSVNWATTLTNAITIPAAGPTHQVIMRGLNQLVGITGWADNLTHIYSTQPGPTNTFGTVVNPAA